MTTTSSRDSRHRARHHWRTIETEAGRPARVKVADDCDPETLAALSRMIDIAYQAYTEGRLPGMENAGK